MREESSVGDDFAFAVGELRDDTEVEALRLVTDNDGAVARERGAEVRDL